MQFETKTEVAPSVRKSGLVEVTLVAVNPSNEQYKTITGKTINFSLNYGKAASINAEGKDIGCPLKALVVDADKNYYLVNLESYMQSRTVGGEATKLYINLVPKKINDKTTVDELKTTWRPSLEAAITEIGEGAYNPKVGEDVILSLLTKHYFSFETAVQASGMFTVNDEGKVDYSAFINHLIETGDWTFFNTALSRNIANNEKSMVELLKKDNRQAYMIMVYSETTGNFVNVKTVSKYMPEKWRLFKAGEINMHEKGDFQKAINQKEYVKGDVFYSVQIGLVEEHGEEIISNETPVAKPVDDLPF